MADSVNDHARNCSWDAHVEAWRSLGRQVDDAAWARAEIAASLKGRYGEDAIGKFAEEVGFASATLYQFAQTFEAFPQKSDRSENLTFTHHRHAVVFTPGTDSARAAVALAAAEGWSANALRAHLRSPALIASPQETCSTNGTCGPPSDDDKIFHISAMVESFYSVKDYEIEPLIRMGSKRSLKQLSRKIKDAITWLDALEHAIKERTK